MLNIWNEQIFKEKCYPQSPPKIPAVITQYIFLEQKNNMNSREYKQNLFLSFSLSSCDYDT